MKIIKFGLGHITEKLALIAYSIINILQLLVTLIIPYITAKLIDILIYDKSMNILLFYCMLIGILYFIRLLLAYILKILYAKIFVSSSYNISRFLIKHIHSCPISRIDTMDSAYYNQRISQDAGAIIGYSINTAIGTLIIVLEIVISTGILLLISPSITLVSGLLLLIYFLLYKYLKKPLYEKSIFNKEDQALYFSKIYEQLSLAKYIKTHSLSEFFLDRLHYAYERFNKSYINFERTSSIYGSFDGVIQSISSILLYIVGGYNVIKDKMTIGSFTIIRNYFLKLMQGISFFFSIAGSYQGALVAYNRLQEILSWETDKNGTIIPSKITEISMNSVNFSYDNRKILSNLSLKLVAGKIYVVVGRNGSGKTTLSELILGLFNGNYQGSIKINGIPIEKINMSIVRKDNIGYIEQEPVLFTDTVLKNVILSGEINSTTNKLLDELHILDFVSQLPMGWDSLITTKNNLSGGEKQRIALSRILIKESEIMILDEPTSALDNKMIDTLLNYLIGLKKDKIIIIISHDEKIINACDDIISL